MIPTGYIENLLCIISSTEIIDGYGNVVEFNEGIQDIVSLIKKQSANGNKTILIGNGGSAAIASHGALDLWKNCGLKALSFNEAALLTCVGNDYGYEHVFEKPVEMFADTGDVVLAVSSSGQSKNILLGVEAAKKIGCKIITLTGFSEDNKLRKLGDINAYVPSDKYGYVELSHQILIHMITDIIMNGNGTVDSNE